MYVIGIKLKNYDRNNTYNLKSCRARSSYRNCFLQPLLLLRETTFSVLAVSLNVDICTSK